jgi:DNA gyrase subunit A
VLITKNGMSIRFSESDVRSMGRAPAASAASTRGGDALVALAIVVPDATLLVAGENGIGKRTGFDEYRIQSRGGKGIITMKTGQDRRRGGRAHRARRPTKSCSSPPAARWCAPQ